MFEFENMPAVNGRMNCTWKMSKLTYFSQKSLSKHKKIKKMIFIRQFKDIRIAT